jgi:hypothetical protein
MSVVRLYVGGDELEFAATLSLLEAAFDALMQVQHQVLGAASDSVQWQLALVQPGSADVYLEPVGAGISDELLGNVIEIFRDGVATIARDPEAHPHNLGKMAEEAIRRIGHAAGAAGLPGLAVERLPRVPKGSIPSPPVDLMLALAPPPVQPPPPSEHTPYVTTLIGRIDSLNRHNPNNRTANLWEESQDRKVRLRYGSELHAEIIEALDEEEHDTRRVQVTGTMVERTDGSVAVMTVQDLKVLPPDDALPRLSEIIGTLPGLAEGLSASEFVRRGRDADESA